MGQSPVDATIFMSKAIAEAEGIYDYEQAYVNAKDEIKNKGTSIQNIDILTTTGCTIAFEESENVDMFVCLTDTGKVARFLAKHHPKQPILACSTSGQTVRQVNMTRGVVGYKIPQYMKEKTDDLVDLILQIA